jgi:putative endonuclease
MERGWHVYILRCADATLYTGIARDLEKRLMQHNGEHVGGPKYTRGRRPVQLAWTDEVSSRSAALKREAQIKKLPRSEKLRLIASSPVRRLLI